jgi:hypothetical protein
MIYKSRSTETDRADLNDMKRRQKMAKSIDPELRKIGDYLKLEENSIFLIPEYQRAYSWGIVNCDKLWQDITDFIETGAKERYFFGTIIINVTVQPRHLR